MLCACILPKREKKMVLTENVEVMHGLNVSVGGLDPYGSCVTSLFPHSQIEPVFSKV
jgi:hypothetical protein